LLLRHGLNKALSGLGRLKNVCKVGAILRHRAAVWLKESHFDDTGCDYVQ
jgi:hypothetical protein